MNIFAVYIGGQCAQPLMMYFKLINAFCTALEKVPFNYILKEQYILNVGNHMYTTDAVSNEGW